MMEDDKVRMFGKIKCFSDFNSICDEGTDPIQNTCGLFARLWVHRNNGLPNDKWDENIVCQVRKSNKINLGDTSDQNIRNDKIVLLVGTEIKGFTIHKKKYHWSWLPEIVMKNPRQQMILEYRPSSSMRFYKSRIIIQPARIEKSENEIGILGIELDLANSDPVNRMPKWNKNQSRRAKTLSASAKVFTPKKNQSRARRVSDSSISSCTLTPQQNSANVLQDVNRSFGFFNGGDMQPQYLPFPTSTFQ